MLRRYFNTPDGAVAPPPPTGARVDTVDIISSSSSTITEKTNIIGGPASGTITFKVTSFGGYGDPGRYINVNGTNIFLGYTFTIATDASGNCDYTSITYGGGFAPSLVNAVITIFSASSGAIGSPSTRSYSRAI